ncbi:unnamed protein product [Rotaria sordida]|uniref:Uncharacterized protein n=2 Tax=Rotaria sordida TaxID=392033 RepID=A0A818K057_9BILA|nr:unnamed protein product [Rotaria sordida]CAF0952409.1 unnamed protein product [Rotaria sordida]CAF3547315.1 unnamed protein product [Rotaria sordida]
MLSDHVFYLFLLIIYFSHGQSTIRIRIIDDNYNYTDFVNIKVPNVTFCGRKGLNLQLHWLNTLDSLPNLINILEFEQNLTDIYLTRTVQSHTNLIRDFCQINHIPFINMKSYGSKTMICSTTTTTTTSFIQEYFIMPNILQVLINYLKFNHVQKAIYIYDNDEATYRIYELLELMNKDEYYNNISLDIRTTRNDDIYSILYSIESNSLQKDRLSSYIVLDLHSYDDYERMFEKISHMGLTSDSYQYIIVSTFDVCLWMNKFNFTGQLIYFDYQQDDCTLDFQSSQNTYENSLSSTKSIHYKSYYRTTLSFRNNPSSSKSLNSTELIVKNSSLLLNDTNINLNLCHNKINSDDKYFSYSYFNSQLPESVQIYSRTLFDALNLIIRIVISNIVDCKTYRLKQTKKIKLNHCNFPYVNIFSIQKSLLNQFKKPIQLIGRYSTINNDYQSCYIDKNKDLSLTDKSLSSKIYYVTSLFEEPFLMLRKGTVLYTKYSQPQANLKELQGRIFDFHELEGYCVDLAEKVCSMLNITCQFRIVQDGRFGSKNKSTGIWDGMIGDIVSRKADMAIAPLTISQIRMEVVDFSKPFMNLGISIMISKPDAQKPGVFSFMNPVSTEIWLCLSLAYFAVSVVLFLTSRVVNSGWQRRVVRRPSYRSFSYPKSVNDRRKSLIESQRQKRDSILSEHSNDFSTLTRSSIKRRHHYRTQLSDQHLSNLNINKNKKKKNESKQNTVHLFGISNALFFSFASFMRQSINLVPKSLSGRIAAISWWYFSLIFVSSYTANLVACLTVENLVAPIKNVEDLANQQEIKYGSLRNGTTSAFFEKSNVTIFQNMWAIMQRSSSEVFVTTNDEGVAKVRNSKGKYAFFIESTKNEYVNERYPCDTMKVGSDLDSKGYGIATRIGSDLTEVIDIIITNLKETGFLDKRKQRWWYDRSECTQTNKDKRFSELSLSSVTGLFYIFLFGIILSCLIAFTEFLITAKNESETLQINFREILQIKMIENMVGITINKQRQVEYGHVEHEYNYPCYNQEDEIIKQYTDYQLRKPQSDV